MIDRQPNITFTWVVQVITTGTSSKAMAMSFVCKLLIRKRRLPVGSSCDIRAFKPDIKQWKLYFMT